jgi:hypothetical protein
MFSLLNSTRVNQLPLGSLAIAMSIFLILIVIFHNTNLVSSTPQVTLQIMSPEKSDMYQLFYDTGKGFNETESVIQMVDKGDGIKDVIFSLPVPLGQVKSIRIDPGSQPTLIKIKSINLTSGGKEYLWNATEILHNFRPAMYIDNFSEKEGLLYVNSTGRDPAFVSSFDFAIFLDNCPFLIIAKELLYILTVSVVIFVLVKIVSLRYFIVRMNKITTIYDSKISDFMSDKNSRLKDLKILSALMAIAIFLHIYEASSFMLSIDDEYSAFRTATSAKIWIYDGRWMAYILSFAFPQPVMPYVPTLMFCFLMSLSYFLLVKSHKLQPDYRIYILYPVYILFPTFWFINEFYANTVNTAFGHVMVALSVFLFSRTRYGKTILISSASVAQIDYLVAKALKQQELGAMKKVLLNEFYQHVTIVKTPATSHDLPDIEDSLIEASAKTLANALVITRDRQFLKRSSLTISPETFIAEHLSPQKMPNIPFVDISVSWQMKNEMETAFDKVLASNWYILGNEVSQFEQEFATYCEVKHCIGVRNGLDALHLILRGLGIGAGDEVIVPANTYIATWLAVSYAGATPVPVEPNEFTYNIDPQRIEPAITPKTKAIIAVHLYGQPADMDAINTIAQKYHLKVIEETNRFNTGNV